MLWHTVMYAPYFGSTPNGGEFALVLIKRSWEAREVRMPLIERLPPDAPELESFDAAVTRVEHRRSVGSNFARNTVKAYERRYRRYVEWCAEVGYQAEPQFITTEKIAEFTEHMVTVMRYMPFTIWQGVRALEIYAERAGIAVSTEPALGVLDAWRDKLEELGVTEPRRRKVRVRRAG